MVNSKKYALTSDESPAFDMATLPVQLSPLQQVVVALRGTQLQVIACAGPERTEVMSRRMAAPAVETVAEAFVVATTLAKRAAIALVWLNRSERSPIVIKGRSEDWVRLGAEFMKETK